MLVFKVLHTHTDTPWPESASEIYRPSHRRLTTKLVPTLTDRGCQVVSVMDPSGRILGFVERLQGFTVLKSPLKTVN
jgi:hypothetical protein